jgi:hypothetical protein
MTAATHSQPSAVQTYVKSAIHLRLRTFWSDGGAGLPLTRIGRQASQARTCFEGLGSHQTARSGADRTIALL